MAPAASARVAHVVLGNSVFSVAKRLSTTALRLLCQVVAGALQDPQAKRVPFTDDVAFEAPTNFHHGAAFLGTLADVGIAAASPRMRVIAMVQSALLACRSPPRFSRWRPVRPDDAWSG